MNESINHINTSKLKMQTPFIYWYNISEYCIDIILLITYVLSLCVSIGRHFTFKSRFSAVMTKHLAVSQILLFLTQK